VRPAPAKSILLGAIGLLLGNRADTKVLWDENEKCITEGSFDISSYSLKKYFESEDLDYEDLTVLRREISPGGKSRAFINDTPVTLEVMKNLGSRLMDVHSQHETLDLGNRRFQLHVIDSFAGNQKIRQGYDQTWRQYSAALVHYKSLTETAAGLRQEYEFTKFQLDELVKAGLGIDEQEELESQLKILEHAEDIKSRFAHVTSVMNNHESSVLSALSSLKSILNPIASFSPAYQQLLDRLESARVELSDIRDEIEKEDDQIEFDPKKIENVKERLSLIYQLLQKHRLKSVGELLELQDSLQLKADKTSNLDEDLIKAKKELDICTGEVKKRASELTKSRENIFNPLAQQLMALLKELGIPQAQLAVHSEAIEPGPSGAETIELLFSANKGVSPKPLAQVASGGEFSRLMFCVKYILADRTSLPTLILDEIDSGVSGEIAIKLGQMMREMAKRHQLIAISHLPQIAAKGDTHYFVFKDNSSLKTTTHIKKLESGERISEIAKMIGGAKPSSLALENARELMAK
jgi:DNA repair protein RecN (Recombination protein N)